jgi:hypothetical protein
VWYIAGLCAFLSVSILRAVRHLRTFKTKNVQIISIFSYIQVEEVAVMGAVMEPVVAMEEVGVMVGLQLEAVVVVVVVVLVLVAIIRMAAHMDQEVVDTREEAMEDMVGVATVVMEEEEEEEDMEEVVVMVAVDMVDMVGQDMGVVQEVHMEETPSMEEQGGLADHSHGAMMVTVLDRYGN